MAEPAWWPPRLTAWVDRVDARWQACGVDQQTRTRLRRDLVTDLGQGLLGGASADETVGIHAEHFADDVLLAEGIERASVPRATRPPVAHAHLWLVVVAFTVTFFGGLVFLLNVVPASAQFAERSGLGYTPMGRVMLFAYGVAGLIAAACGGLAARWLIRGHPRPWLLATVLSFALALSGFVAALLIAFIVLAAGASGQLGVVFTAVVLVGLIFAAAVAVVSWLLPAGPGLSVRTDSDAR